VTDSQNLTDRPGYDEAVKAAVEALGRGLDSPLADARAAINAAYPIIRRNVIAEWEVEAARKGYGPAAQQALVARIVEALTNRDDDGSIVGGCSAAEFILREFGSPVPTRSEGSC
jgi:hypothetical protein